MTCFGPTVQCHLLRLPDFFEVPRSTMMGFDRLIAAWQPLATLALAAALGAGVAPAMAQERLPSFGPAGAPVRSMQEWVDLFQKAPHEYSFKGVFMVSIPKRATVFSSRIVHWAKPGTVIERVEALQGSEQITLREGQQLIGISPGEKVVRIEELQRMDWASPVAAAPMRASPYYKVMPGTKTRVAGWDAHVVDFRAVDEWRLSYRIWSDVQRGLILKMQALSPSGRVLEQREFVELSFDVTEQAAKELRQEMKQLPSGYRVLKFKLNKVDLGANGWQISSAPPGFDLVQCFARVGVPALQWMQCVFSDGMSSASVFIEPLDERQNRRSGRGAFGGMHTVALRYQHEDRAWWLTAMGEVPLQTLTALTDALTREAAKKP